MAISIRQVMAESNGSKPAMPEQEMASSRTSLEQWSDIQRLAAQLAGKLYDRLHFSNWVPQQWFNGALVPAQFLQSSGPGLRRIVEIGCGDGTFTNLMALLMPEVEIVGIDTDARKIEKAQGTVGRRGNIRFVQGNALTMDEIPCDRIVYNHCLSDSENVFKFKKMIFKTSQWLVDEGDFWVKESLPGLLMRPALLQILAAYVGSKNPIEALIAQALTSMGHPLEEACLGQGVFGLSSELFLRAFPLGPLTPLQAADLISAEPTPVRAVSVMEQTNDALVGFLFEKAEQNWQKILV